MCEKKIEEEGESSPGRYLTDADQINDLLRFYLSLEFKVTY